MKELLVLGAAVVGGIAVLHLGRSRTQAGADAAQHAALPGSSVPTAAQPATGTIASVNGSPIHLRPGEFAPTASPMIGAPTKALAGSTAPNPVAPILPGPTGYAQIASSAGGFAIKRTASTTPQEINQQIAQLAPFYGVLL